MTSKKLIQIESPRQGIIKSFKNIDDHKHKEEKKIKIDVLETKKTISINGDNDSHSISFDNQQTPAQKGEVVTIKSMKSLEPSKKSCLKISDGSGQAGLSLKKITTTEETPDFNDCKSARSAKSIKFNNRANVYVYPKDGSKGDAKVKKQDTAKKSAKEIPPGVEVSEEDACCEIF